MNCGRLLWFNRQGGYGMILHDDGRQVYFHYTAIQGFASGQSMEMGTKAYFDVFMTGNGWEADRVVLFD